MEEPFTSSFSRHSLVPVVWLLEIQDQFSAFRKLTRIKEGKKISTVQFYNKVQRSPDTGTQEYLNRSVGKTGDSQGS